MNDDEIEKRAVEEILLEAKRAKERADEHGTFGWNKPAVAAVNKRFLKNTLVSTLRESTELRKANHFAREGRLPPGQQPSQGIKYKDGTSNKIHYNEKNSNNFRSGPQEGKRHTRWSSRDESTDEKQLEDEMKLPTDDKLGKQKQETDNFRHKRPSHRNSSSDETDHNKKIEDSKQTKQIDDFRQDRSESKKRKIYDTYDYIRLNETYLQNIETDSKNKKGDRDKNGKMKNSRKHSTPERTKTGSDRPSKWQRP